jgi:ATP-binding cassette subfamily C (CFTR/MRP) protein 1
MRIGMFFGLRKRTSFRIILLLTLDRWLAVRLEFLGSLIILSAAGFAIISVSTGSGLSAGLVGLAMSYALQITQSLNWIVRQTVEVETNIVSVERVLEYARLPSEAPEVIHRNRPPISWPASGAVQFNNYSTRYREGLDLVLKGVNLNIKPHEKIGVVGRTGAGKSSLTLALFRIIEPSEGNISIDALDTSTIGLLDLRRRLAIIPQDAALFEGTIRDNLDPGHVHDDTELWSVLGKSSIPRMNHKGCASWYLRDRILQAAHRIPANELLYCRTCQAERPCHYYGWWARSQN